MPTTCLLCDSPVLEAVSTGGNLIRVNPHPSERGRVFLEGGLCWEVSKRYPFRQGQLRHERHLCRGPKE